MRSAIRGSSGFTLLEVILALAIVGVAVTVILQLFSSNLRNVGSSEDYVKATLRAESRLREVVDDVSLSERQWSETTSEGYRIDVAVSPTQVERADAVAVKLFRVDLTCSWRTGTKNRTISLSTLKLVKPVEEGREATAT